MGLTGIGLDGEDWIDLVQDRDQWCAAVQTVMQLCVPYNFDNLVTVWQI
jgi:hypothetical protein